VIVVENYIMVLFQSSFQLFKKNGRSLKGGRKLVVIGDGGRVCVVLDYSSKKCWRMRIYVLCEKC
jgi:hypothetical protein